MLPIRRQIAGAIVGAILLPVLTVVMAGMRDSFELPGTLLLYLLAVVAVAAIGGVLPALAASVAAFLLANFYFIPPLHEFAIHEGKDLIALIVFLLVAGVAGVVLLRSTHAPTIESITPEQSITSPSHRSAAGPFLSHRER